MHPSKNSNHKPHSNNETGGIDSVNALSMSNSKNVKHRIDSNDKIGYARGINTADRD